MNEYNVTINNGTGNARIANGSYSVTANSSGYNVSSIDPSTLNVVEGTNEYAFTIEATGTLTLHVTEDGTEGGTPVVGAVFNRTNQAGDIFGPEIVTNDSGNAIFNNVPFDATNAPLIYYKQISTVVPHEFDSSVKSTSLTSDTLTVEVTNALAVERTVTLTDKNYANLPIDNAEITLN